MKISDQPARLTLCRSPQLLRLSVRHPGRGMCVVQVQGELDMLTAPLLDDCLREQLFRGLPHLVVDLEGVDFLGASGLRCLVEARELAPTAGVVLHLAGLINRAVHRPLMVLSLLPLFRCYLTVAQVLPESS